MKRIERDRTRVGYNAWGIDMGIRMCVKNNPYSGPVWSFLSFSSFRYSLMSLIRSV